MDWSKAKSILIFIFFALNIFLLYQLIFSSARTISTDNLGNTLKVLEQRGVVLKCDIPAYSNDDATISYEDNPFNRDIILKKILGDAEIKKEVSKTAELYSSSSKKLMFLHDNYFVYTDSRPEKKVDMDSMRGVEKYLRNLLKEMNISEANYILDSVEAKADGSVELFLTERHKRFLLFDNYVKAEFSELGLRRLECRKAMSYSVPSNKIIPAYQVLLQNFTSDEKPVITALDIGFREAGQDTHGLKAVWRVKIEGSSPRFFDAFTGKILED